MLPPYIIKQIREREKKPEEYGIPLELPVPYDPSRDSDPRESEKEDENRGVHEIVIIGDDEDDSIVTVIK